MNRAYIIILLQIAIDSSLWFLRFFVFRIYVFHDQTSVSFLYACDNTRVPARACDARREEIEYRFHMMYVLYRYVA